VDSLKYWYLEEVWYCPVCGSEDRYRVRMYTPKPEDRNLRHIWHEAWDYCSM